MSRKYVIVRNRQPVEEYLKPYHTKNLRLSSESGASHRCDIRTGCKHLWGLSCTATCHSRHFQWKQACMCMYYNNDKIITLPYSLYIKYFVMKQQLQEIQMFISVQNIPDFW
jgi:hypothetical protein